LFIQTTSLADPLHFSCKGSTNAKTCRKSYGWMLKGEQGAEGGEEYGNALEV